MPAGLNDPESRMNLGKTLFAQVMEFVPWNTFARIIERHTGDAGARTLGCADLFRIWPSLSVEKQEFSIYNIETYFNNSIN